MQLQLMKIFFGREPTLYPAVVVDTFRELTPCPAVVVDTFRELTPCPAVVADTRIFESGPSPLPRGCYLASEVIFMVEFAGWPDS